MTLADDISDRIKARGPLTFAAFMQIALYDRTQGYYGSGKVRTGWHGQFVTSPELDPAFGELWTRAFEQAWVACERPPKFEIVEIGGGEGAFASAVLDSATGDFARAVEYRLVERSARVANRQRDLLGSDERITWVASLDEIDDISSGCVFANEVLDNMPVHLIEGRTDGFVELFVGLDGDRLALVEGPPRNNEVASYLERHRLRPKDGARIEIGIAAEQMVKRLASLVDRGALMFVDYGDVSETLVQRAAGTLVAYSKAGVDDDVLADIGDKDITSHVNWTAVMHALTTSGLEVHGPYDQRDVLRALGSRELDAQLRGAHKAAVLEGNGAIALQTMSRRQALGALTDPGGLGGLDVVIATRSCSPSFLAEL